MRTTLYASQRVPPGHVAGAVVFVSEMARALTMYADLLGLDAAAPAPLDAWLAAAVGRRRIDGRVVELSADGFPAGRIWLVELADLAPGPPRRTDRVENGGTVMVFSSATINALADRLAAAGAPRIADPEPMVSEWGRSQEFISFDPDGAPVCLIEMLAHDGRRKLDLAAPWVGARTDQTSPLLRVSQFVANLDQSIAFYRDRLGMRKLDTREFDRDVGRTLGIPPCRLRMTYMSAPETPWEPGMATVGITEVSDPALTKKAAPPARVYVGQVATVLAVSDPNAVLAGLRASGARFLDGGEGCFDPDCNLIVLIEAG